MVKRNWKRRMSVFLAGVLLCGCLSPVMPANAQRSDEVLPAETVAGGMETVSGNQTGTFDQEEAAGDEGSLLEENDFGTVSANNQQTFTDGEQAVYEAELIADGYVEKLKPAECFGKDTQLKVKNPPQSPNEIRCSYMKFNVSENDADKAVLKLFVWDTSIGLPITADIYATETSWDEETLCWNNIPSVIGEKIASTSITNSDKGKVIEFDVSDYVLGKTGELSFQLTSASAYQFVRFDSKETVGGVAPALILTKEEPEEQPQEGLPTDRAPMTFYIDSYEGNDENEGTSPQTPWKTFEMINKSVLIPGDTVLLKAGSIWNDTQLWIEGSGTAEKPITIDMYGSGNKPILNGNGTHYPARWSSTVMLYGCSYTTLKNLEVTNDAKGDPGSPISGILVWSIGGESKGVTVSDCYVHDVYNYPSYPVTMKSSGGITAVLSSYAKDGSTVDAESWFTDLVIENNTIKDVAMTGMRMTRNFHKTDWNYNKKSTADIRGNYLENIGGDAIVVQATKSAVVEHNVVNKHCTADVGNRNYAAVWASVTDNVVFQNNEVYGGIYGYNDGEAFDVDLNCNGIIYQYNYSHNNRGGLCLFMPNQTNSIFRYNLSVNDGQGTEIFHYALGSGTSYVPSIYNNTIYIGPHIKTCITKQDKTAYVNMKNNIFLAHGEVTGFSNYGANGTVLGTFENNCVWPKTLFADGSIKNEAGTVYADPKLAWAGREELGLTQGAQYYKLQADSPCIDAGVLVENNGGRDYFGNLLPETGIDIGIHEFSNDTSSEVINPDEPKLTAVALSDKLINLRTTETRQLTAQVEASEYPFKGIIWSSSDETIATVNDDGEVTALKEGTVFIRAASEINEKIYDECKVFVTQDKRVCAELVADTYSDFSKKGANYGNDTQIKIKIVPADKSVTRETYLKFDLGEVKAESAVLNLFVRPDTHVDALASTIYVYGVEDNSWQEDTLCANNAPQAGEVMAVRELKLSDLGQTISLDVSDYLKDKTGQVSLKITSDETHNQFIRFDSKETENGRPPVLLLSTEAFSIRYLDEEGNEVHPEQRVLSNKGESFGFEIPEVDGYELVKKPENLSGIVPEHAQDMVFIYHRTAEEKEIYKNPLKDDGDWNHMIAADANLTIDKMGVYGDDIKAAANLSYESITEEGTIGLGVRVASARDYVKVFLQNGIWYLEQMQDGTASLDILNENGPRFQAGEQSRLLVMTEGTKLTAYLDGSLIGTADLEVSGAGYAGIVAGEGIEGLFAGDFWQEYAQNVTIDRIAAQEQTIKVALGTTWEECGLDEKAEVLLSDGTTVYLDINWNDGGYDKDSAGTYRVEGEIILPANVKAEDKVIVVANLVVEDSEPTDPSEPMDPSEPTDPSNPTDPSEPTDPSNPTDPSEPSTPDSGSNEQDNGGNDAGDADNNAGDDGDDGNDGNGSGQNEDATETGAEQITAPQTGDSTNFKVWGVVFVILIVSCAVVGAIVFRKEEEDL